MNIGDVEPLIPMIEHPGGVISNWRRNPVGAHGGQVIAATSRKLLEEMLLHLAGAAADL